MQPDAKSEYDYKPARRQRVARDTAISCFQKHLKRENEL